MDRTLRHPNRILIEGDQLPVRTPKPAHPQGRELTRPTPASEQADMWISRAATATVAGLAGIASAICYGPALDLKNVA